jgi:hypothetical protein
VAMVDEVLVWLRDALSRKKMVWCRRRTEV